MFMSIPAHLGYGVLAGLVFGESAGLPIPGETALVGASFLAASGQLSLPLVIGVTASAAMLGDNLGFWFGRRGGRRALLATRGPFRRHRHHLLARGETFFGRHGAKAVFLSRWVAGLRPVAAVVAGATGMPVKRFLVANALGAIAWASTTALLVYWLGGVGAALAIASGWSFAAAGVASAAVGSWRSRRRAQAVRRVLT